MKKVLLSIALVVAMSSQAQTIVNAGFENYKTNANEEPVGWMLKSNSPGGVGSRKLAVKSTDAHSGSAAVLIRNIDPDLGTFFGPFSLDVDDQAASPPIDLANKRPAGMKAWVKFHRGDLSQPDSVLFFLIFYNTAALIGSVDLWIAPPQDVYTEVTIPINYSAGGGGIAAFGYIATGLSDGNFGRSGSADSTTVLIDDLSFYGTATGVDNEEASSNAPKLISNVTPNHFAVEHTLAEASIVSISVFDMLGKTVILSTEQHLPAGTYRSQVDLSGLSPATYYIVFNALTQGRKVFSVSTL